MICVGNDSKSVIWHVFDQFEPVFFKPGMMIVCIFQFDSCCMITVYTPFFSQILVSSTLTFIQENRVKKNLVCWLILSWTCQWREIECGFLLIAGLLLKRNDQCFTQVEKVNKGCVFMDCFYLFKIRINIVITVLHYYFDDSFSGLVFKIIESCKTTQWYVQQFFIGLCLILHI